MENPMRHPLGFIILLAASTFALAQTAGPKPSQQLTEEIVARDKAFFAALFDACDPKALATMVTEDFEMFHDKGGRTSTSGAQFVKDIEAMCERRRTGVDYRARREAVPGTVKVYPINNYGALQVGEHR